MKDKTMSAKEPTHAGSDPVGPTEAPHDEEPRPIAYGYFRAPFSEQMEGNLIVGDLMECVQRYCDLKKLDLKGFFADEAETSRVNLWSRPRGDLLDRQLRRGDRVIFPRLQLGFRNTKDLLDTIDCWTGKGIVVHLCDLNIDSAHPAWPTLTKMLRDVARSERKRIGERMALVVNGVRRQNRRFTRRAPFGYRWEPDPKGTKTKRGNPAMVMVADKAQQRQIRQIAKMHEEKTHYYKIWLFFISNNIKRASDGKDWDLRGIWQVINRLRQEKRKREGR
jgi:putative DNA-invertase from lambdoid prophage Rac